MTKIGTVHVEVKPIITDSWEILLADMETHMALVVERAVRTGLAKGIAGLAGDSDA